MNDADQLRRIALLREFKETLPTLVREFSVETLTEMIIEAEQEYLEDQERWDVVAERNSRDKQMEAE